MIIMCLKMYESNRIYAIGYEINGDFIKICTFNKNKVSKETVNNFIKYLIGL